MTTFEFSVAYTVLGFFLAICVKLMSDVTAERVNTFRTLVTVGTLLIAIFSSFGISLLLWAGSIMRFKLLFFLITGCCIFFIYFGLSLSLGLRKRRKDELKKYKHQQKGNESRDSYGLEACGAVRDTNSCMRSVSGPVRDTTPCIRVIGGTVQADKPIRKDGTFRKIK